MITAFLIRAGLAMAPVAFAWPMMPSASPEPTPSAAAPKAARPAAPSPTAPAVAPAVPAPPVVASPAPAPTGAFMAAPPPQEPVTGSRGGAANETVGCPPDRIEEVIHLLQAWMARVKEAQRAAYADRGCERPEVLCLNRLGEIEADALPDRARTGQIFTIEVVLPVGDSGKVAVSASGSRAVVAAGPFGETAAPPPQSRAHSSSCDLSPAQRDQLKAAAFPIAQWAGAPGLESLDVPQGSSQDVYWQNSTNADIFSNWYDWSQAHREDTVRFTAVEAKVEVPFAQSSLDIEFSRTEQGSASPSVDKHYGVWIDSGTYHIEASVLVPFVFRGRRVATLTPTPSGNEFQVGLNQDWHVTAAIMIDLFPFGRQKGQVSSFEHCRSGSCAENWLGLQFGTGLSSIFQEWYLGLLFEPVSGLGIGGGAAFLKGDFLGPGLAEGMLLPSAAEFSKNSDYMVRPYFGVAITTDLFQTLDRSSVFARIW